MSDAELLPTVVLEHARTGQPIIVDLKDYLAGGRGKFANWRLLGHGTFADPPALSSDLPDAAAEPDDGAPEQDMPRRRRRRRQRRS